MLDVEVPRPLGLPERRSSQAGRRTGAGPDGQARRPLECQVVHSVNGRVRLRVPALRRDPEYADRAVAVLTQCPGVYAARASVACASLVVSYDPAVVDLTEIGEWLDDARESGVAQTSVQPVHAERTPRGRPRAHPSVTALVSGGAGLAFASLGAPGLLTAGLIAISAIPIVARAARSIFSERKIGVDALDSTVMTALALQGDLPVAALSATLIAAGEYIRALTSRRSRTALAGLLSTTGRYVWAVRGKRMERLPLDSLEVGDTIVVYPGELVLVDGVVIRGQALVDQKILTGESTPVLKQAGDIVYASTVLRDGKLHVRAEQLGNATRAARIVQILEGAPLHDTRIANYAGRFADRLVLPTIGLAAGTALVTRNVSRAVSILVFDFATGIRVSVPTAVLASMHAAVRQDLLIKGGRALEELAKMDTLVFDKTGTLTIGEPQVTGVESLSEGVSRDDVLRLAAALERRLTHPAARAIVNASEERGLSIPRRDGWKYTVGLGVEAEVEGDRLVLGSAHFHRHLGIAVSKIGTSFADAAGRRGASTVFLARNGAVIGLVSYADVARAEARAVLRRLRDRGIGKLIMVTGDSARVARVVARQLGFDEVEAEVFPERKAEIVRDLQAQGHVVGVIGDGINDSPALAYADVSFSLKAGADVARETADVVLHGDLHGLAESIDFARECMRLIRQNLALVAVPNAAGMALATAGMIGPAISTALNNGSAVLASVNALRPLLPASRPLSRPPGG